MKGYFDRAFRYHAWANEAALASLRDCPAAVGEAVPLMAHLLAADQVWLSRLRASAPSPVVLWPASSLEECRTRAAECERGWADYLSGATPESLLADVDYRNTRGEPFRNASAEILTHVLIHGSYHRGQIAKAVGRAGGKAAVTDYIAFIRGASPPAARDQATLSPGAPPERSARSDWSDAC